MKSAGELLLALMEEARDQGLAVVVFIPDELGTLSPREVEMAMTKAGLDLIAANEEDIQ